MSTNKIMELADAYANNRHADGYAHMEETPNTAKARAALQAEVECVTKELAGTEAVNKAAAMEIVSLRAELAAAKAEPVYGLLDWIINECVIYPESDDEKKFAKRLLDAITHPKAGYTHPAPKAEPVNKQLLEALKDAESSLSDYHAGAPWGKYDLDVLEKARATIAAAEEQA